MRFVAFAAVIAVSALGCSLVKTGLSSKDLDRSVGSDVTLVGIADSRKGGAALHGDDFYVWLENVASWPETVVMKKVEVKGRLEVDQGLPVFIQHTNDLTPQGIPVPAGTDMRKASMRYVLAQPTWKLLK